MKIDAHQHFWKYSKKTHPWISDDMKPLKQDFLPEDLKPHLDKAGMDGCIAIESSQTQAENKYLLGLADEHDWIKGVVGWVDLRSDKVQGDLAKLAENKNFKGVRHALQDEKDPEFMLSYDFNLGVTYLKDHDLCYEVLVYQHQMEQAFDFIERHPYTKLVLDHIGKPLIRQGEMKPWTQWMADLAMHCENLYIKFSGMVTEADHKNWKPEEVHPYMDHVLECFGPDRIIFGSDWPVCELAGGYKKSAELVFKYIKSLSKDEQAAILGGNAVEFYGL